MLFISLFGLLSAADMSAYLYNKAIDLYKTFPGRTLADSINLKVFENGTYECANNQCTLSYYMIIQALAADFDQTCVYKGKVLCFLL
jgi:hypothetical protein